MTEALVLPCPADPPAARWAHVGYAVPEWVAAGDPVEEAVVFHRGKKTVTGVWRCRPGVLRIDAYPFDEFCVVLEGHCVLTPTGGAAQRFGPGDAFVICKGFSGEWAMPEGLRKYYVETHA